LEVAGYDEVDPVGVLDLNLLCLGYALTPERMEVIRRLDPRPFPSFGVYAIEEGIVVGQVGLYRLPMVTTEGPEDVGGICAMCTHPAFGRRGIAARLLEEAHARMRSAGLRFSTLGTNRYRTAHVLYQRYGYEDVFRPASTLARLDQVMLGTDLRVERADAQRRDHTDEVFRRATTGKLGFSRRHERFFSMLVDTGELGAGEVWLVYQERHVVGYALARVEVPVLRVSNLLLEPGVEAAHAVVALAQESRTQYIQVRSDQASIAASLHMAGWPRAQPSWDTFMMKPLVPEVTMTEAGRLFGLGTERFMLSRVDLT
jgi:GNAT superfamily N-acetyltransferase